MSNGKHETEIARRGLLLVMSSPSGAGKTTLSRALLASRSPHPHVGLGDDAAAAAAARSTARTISSSPRSASPQMRDAASCSNGRKCSAISTARRAVPVEDALAKGRDVLFDIDWQGTQQLAQAMEDDLVRIFILPPSAEELRDRLIKRAQDSRLGRRQAHGRGLARDQPLARI